MLDEKAYGYIPLIYTEMVYKICGKILEDWTRIEYDRRHVGYSLFLFDVLWSFNKVTLAGRRNWVGKANGAIGKLN